MFALTAALCIQHKATVVQYKNAITVQVVQLFSDRKKGNMHFLANVNIQYSFCMHKFG